MGVNPSSIRFPSAVFFRSSDVTRFLLSVFGCVMSSVLLVSCDVGGFSASRPARARRRFNAVPAIRLGSVQGFIRSPNYLIGVRHRPSGGGNTNAHGDRQRRGVTAGSEPAYGVTGMSPSPTGGVAPV